MGSSIDLPSLEQHLHQLISTIRQSNDDTPWSQVQSTAQSLANGLRSKDGKVDNHTVLGKTSLPQSLTTLLSLALDGSPIPPDHRAAPIFELLRVAANLSMDHDENRAHLLDVGFPQAVVSLLEGYADTVPSSRDKTPFPLSIPHLKVVRTSIGVLLNTSIGYEPVKSRLNSLETALTILKLSTAIYPPTSWLIPASETPDQDLSEEIWTLRSGISNWAWRAIGELKEVKDETMQIFSQDVLPLLTPPLLAFCSPYPESTPLFPPESDMSSTLIDTDFEVIEETCTLIESLSLDVEDVRLALARGLYFPAEHGGVACLWTILDFIEHGTYPPQWNTAFGEAERKRNEKAFDICKAALIKSVVEVAGEESNDDVLWDDSEEAQPGGKFVCKMVNWIKQYVADLDSAGVNNVKSPGREDLVICASLALGNLARREKNSTALITSPHSLSPVLASLHFFSPDSDMKVKHGVLGLLKHLAQSSALSPSIRTSLAEAEIVHRISESGVWDEKADAMAEVVQLNAIGVVKHLCNSSVDHTLALVLPNEQSTRPNGLSQILALASRSDSVPIKSEGTRVLVNVIKSLWSSEPVPSGAPNGTSDEDKRRKKGLAISKVLTPECTFALAALVGRSGKYPILVNEGIVALSLLSTHKEGAPLVLKSILIPIPSASTPVSAEPLSSASTSSDVSSPLVTTPPPLSARPRLPVPRHALDMLAFVLRNVDNPANFPTEVRVNACSFFVQLSKYAPEEELRTVKETVRPILEKLLESQQQGNVQGKDEMLIKAAKRVLDAWAQ